MFVIQTIALSVIAYLLCSLSFALVAAKLFKFEDPRVAGSGNPGATNVLRLGGKKAAALVLIGDIVKGIIPILIAKGLGLPLFFQSIIALFAVLGHIYPIYYKFKGGKGVATTLGVLLALNPLLGLAAMITWLLIAVAFRYSSLASIVMAMSLPAYAFAFHLYPAFPASLLIAGIVVIRHRSNIRKLIAGTESKIGKKKPSVE